MPVSASHDQAPVSIEASFAAGAFHGFNEPVAAPIQVVVLMAFFCFLKLTFKCAVRLCQILRCTELAAIQQRHELGAGGCQFIRKLRLDIISG